MKEFPVLLPIISALVRAAMFAAFGWLVSRGYLSAEDLEATVPTVALLVVPLLWMIAGKLHSKFTKDAARALPPDTPIAEIKEAATERLKQTIVGSNAPIIPLLLAFSLACLPLSGCSKSELQQNQDRAVRIMRVLDEDVPVVLAALVQEGSISAASAEFLRTSVSSFAAKLRPFNARFQAFRAAEFDTPAKLALLDLFQPAVAELQAIRSSQTFLQLSGKAQSRIGTALLLLQAMSGRIESFLRLSLAVAPLLESDVREFERLLSV